MSEYTSLESLELAMRDEISLVLDGQEQIMQTLNDIKAQNDAIKAEITALAAIVKTMMAERAAAHSAALDEVAAGQADVLAAVKSAGEEIASANAVPTP